MVTIPYYVHDVVQDYAMLFAVIFSMMVLIAIALDRYQRGKEQEEENSCSIDYEEQENE